MITKIIEATNGAANWGKFLLAQFDNDAWARYSAVAPESRLLLSRGWTPRHTWVLDLQTGEGALFKIGGLAKADLDKHNIWVCPLFEPFLTWLYAQAVDGQLLLSALPDHIDLPDAPFDYSGYRRDGGLYTMRQLAQDLLTSYQRFACNADGCINNELEERANELGLDTAAWLA